MALTEVVQFDVTRAQRQIAALEEQLASLGSPINVPVNVTGEGDVSRVRQELGTADTAAENLNRELAQTDDELRQAGTQARRTGGDLDAAARRGSSSFAGLRTSVLGLVGAFGLLQVGGAAFRFFGDAITEASDLEQSVGALEAVFGDLGAEVAAFGDVADQSVGLAASQFNQLASLLGSQLQTFGFNVAGAADESQRLIGVAADLAATFGGPVSEAVEAISSLLRGEVNPIERYGVAMNQTLVNAKALELGLAATTAELTLQDTTMARLAILTEQTANAQGQFAREANTTAGQLERIRADFRNFTADAGEALVPFFQSLLDLVPPLVSALEGTLIPALAGIGTTMEGIDTAGFITFLAGLPSGVDTAASQFSTGAQAFGNAFQVLGSIAMLDFGGIGTQFQQLGDDIVNFKEAGIANEAVQNLIQTFATGVDPATALNATLKELGENVGGLTVETFEILATQLVNMAVAAGATAPELADLGQRILTFGEDAGFSAAGVEILTDLLNGPLAQAAASQTGENFALNAQAIESMGGAAEGAAGPLEEATIEIAGLATESERAAGALEEAATQLLALTSPAFAAVDAQGGVADAQTALAEAVEEFGTRSPEAIQAALDLAEAEIRLTEAAANLPGGMDEATGAILDTIDDGEVATSTLEALIEMLDELNGTVTEAQINLLINTFGGTTAGSFAVGPGFEGVNRDRPDPRDQGPNQGGGVAVTQNFYTEPGPTTETERAAQQVNAIVGGPI